MREASTKRRSWNSCSSVFVWAYSLLRLNRLPSRWQQMHTAPSSSRSSMACLSIMLKKMLNRVGARTQPCFTPLTMGKGPEWSLYNLTWPHLSLCSWITCRGTLGATKVHHDHPQSLSSHCVKRFGQVHKCYIQFFVLHPVFLLELSEDKHHVCGAPIGSEPTLSFW